MSDSIKKQKRKTNSGKRKKRRRRQNTLRQNIKAFLSCFLLLGALGFGIWYFSYEEIRLADHVAIELSGYDTKGTATLSLTDTDSHASFFDTVVCSLQTPNGSLSNGDTVTVRFTYDEALAKKRWLRVKAQDAVFPVSGLPEGTPLTKELLFQNVVISSEGIPPLLTLTVSNESNLPFLKDISYEIIDAREFYDVGDTIRIRAVFSEEDAVLNEYITPDSEEALILTDTVPEQTRYLTDGSLLTAPAISELNETASVLFADANEYGLRIFSEANLMPEWTNGKTTFQWSSPRLISVYFNTLKPEHYGDDTLHVNDVKLVYLVTLSQKNGVSCEAEAVVRFSDLMQNADGSLSLALDSAKIIAASYQNSHIVNLVNDEYHDEYESEKLSLVS